VDRLGDRGGGTSLSKDLKRSTGGAVAVPRIPGGLGIKGSRLWREVCKLHELAPPELVLLEEACRIADRLDRLDALLSGESDTWLRFKVNDDGSEVSVVVDSALSEARQQANVLKQLVAALRLPDEQSGKRPQQRGGGRGSYTPSAKKSGATVTALASARAARGA